MGLFTGLLTLPLAPVRGVVWVAEKIGDEVDRQFYDDGSIRRELLQLELDYEDGIIGPEEREARELALVDRLSASQVLAGTGVSDDG